MRPKLSIWILDRLARSAFDDARATEPDWAMTGPEHRATRTAAAIDGRERITAMRMWGTFPESTVEFRGARLRGLLPSPMLLKGK